MANLRSRIGFCIYTVLVFPVLVPTYSYECTVPYVVRGVRRAYVQYYFTANYFLGSSFFHSNNFCTFMCIVRNPIKDIVL